MHRTRRPHPLLVVATVVGMLLAGCGGDEDVDATTFADDLYERTGEDEDVVPRAVVDCITEKVFEEWADDQGEINRIYRAADEDELGNETRDRLNLFNQQCFEAHQGDAGGEGTDAGAEGDDGAEADEGDDADTTDTTEGDDPDPADTTESDTSTTEG